MESESGGDALTRTDISRYSRQLILPELGVSAQLALKRAAVLIVGAGGLGCPSGTYLASAGVGTIGIVDYDVVEMDNLHRQPLHSESSIGSSKTESFTNSLRALNSSISYVTHNELLTSANALVIVKDYDIVLDCTDNVATRYLLNDVSVILKKPLVSGSALRMEGQLTVYNYNSGPCYRCLFPVPPPPEGVTNCSEGGVLGVIPGIIGCIQALETIKIITKLDSSYSGKMLLFDGREGTFRTVVLRSKQDNCSVCGREPTITKPIDYTQFCGASPTDKVQNVELLGDGERIACHAYKELSDSGCPHVLVDVRSPPEMDICSIPKSINVPMNQLDGKVDFLKKRAAGPEGGGKIFVVCRRGNDSQRAVVLLKDRLTDIEVKDLIGGLYKWAEEVDPNFPLY